MGHGAVTSHKWVADGGIGWILDSDALKGGAHGAEMLQQRSVRYLCEAFCPAENGP